MLFADMDLQSKNLTNKIIRKYIFFKLQQILLINAVW